MILKALKTLDDLATSDRTLVGGKAYNCGRLKQAGFPVPDGLAIPADMTDEEIAFLFSDQTSSRVASLPAEGPFAVRSSGIGEDSEEHSFAGIHETQLNVARAELLEAVLLCRRSAKSDQAEAYRKTRHLGDEGGIGVLVQEMIPAQISGVAFTANPITGADEIVINAAPGLGEALVSGLVNPDEFVVRKGDSAILSSRVAQAALPALSNVQIGDLSRLLLEIERHCGAPQDVEWCHDGRQFWIVQSRPVTTIAPATAPKSPVHHPAAAIDIEWTRANLAEVFPDQMSPQVIDAYATMLNAGQRHFMGRLLKSDAELGPMFKVFRGRMYMNLSQMRHVVALAGAPVADMLRSLGHSEQIHPEDEVGTRAPLRDTLRCLPDFIRIGIADARAEHLLRRHEQRTKQVLARLQVDPRALTDRELWNVLEEKIAAAPDDIQIVFVMSGVLFRETALRKACVKVGCSYERLVYPQLAAGERSVSTQQALDLVGLVDAAQCESAARAYLLANDGTFTNYREALMGTGFLVRFDRFLDQYGHRGRYESDWALPRLHENPASALFAISEQLRSHAGRAALETLAERQNADASAAWREFEARLTTWQRWTLLPRMRSMLARLKKQYVWREQVRSDLTRGLRYVRQYYLTLADRFVERGWIDGRDDFFLLKLSEIAPAIADPRQSGGLKDIVRRRRGELMAERDLRMPLYMRESELPARLTQTPSAGSWTDSTHFTGLCVSPGIVEAEVIVMKDPSEFARMKRGAILVTVATDPSWTPLFTLASGVIVEVGGMLSHASTIAREYGLPALANVRDATRVFETGDRVRLDATGGVVIRS